MPPDYPSDRLIIPDDLDFAARADFTTDASRVIEHAHAQIEVDCSKITVIDPPTIGMLVWITRNAKRRGISVVLDSASDALMLALDAAGVADRFATPD